MTALCTKYTGQSDHELAGFEGQAVFTVPARLTRQQAIDLLVNDGISIDDAIAVVDTIGVSDTIGVDAGSHSHPAAENPIAIWKFDVAVGSGTTTNPYLICNNTFIDVARISGSSSYIRVSKANYEAFPGAPIRFRCCMNVYNLYGLTAHFAGHSADAATATDYATVKSGWIGTSASWADFNGYTFDATISGTHTPAAGITEVWVEIEYASSVAHAATDKRPFSSTPSAIDELRVEHSAPIINTKLLSDAIAFGSTVRVGRLRCSWNIPCNWSMNFPSVQG